MIMTPSRSTRVGCLRDCSWCTASVRWATTRSTSTSCPSSCSTWPLFYE
jgi:hypothetical protein